MTGDDLRDRETDRLARSGWVSLAPLRETVRDPRQLLDTQSSTWWTRVSKKIDDMRALFHERQCADDADWGLLYVPALDELDTREPRDADFRSLQHESLADDFVDEKLSELRSGSDGPRFYVTTVGQYGIPLGSYDDISAMSVDDMTIDGQDLRRGMTRQLWGARLAQAGNTFLPDWEGNERWTFTLFVGDDLVDGQVASGTVLKGRARFRLGKTSRGIVSARVAPALEVPLA